MENKSDSIKNKPSKTNWNKVINQTDSEIIRNIKNDPDSSRLQNKKYYKPEKTSDK